MIVVDAPLSIEVLLRSDVGERAAARMADARDRLHAPHLIDVEVLSALRRMVRSGDIDEARADDARALFDGLRLRRWSAVPLRARIWELRENVTPYDACYVALAERLACPLVTCDARLARSSGHRAVVESFAG